MGHKTILHGYIVERMSLEDAQRNDERIAALPEWSPDAWPLVFRSMFARPTYSYLGRIIPFGTSYSGVEGKWQQWRDEFEVLLRTLYWDEVHVWVETEIWGGYHCTWTKHTPDPDEEASTDERDTPVREDTLLDDPCGPPTEWVYWGPQRNVVR